MRLATYNVLANAYIRPAWYEAVPAGLLDPSRRRAALLGRIEQLDADVLCLQEVEEDCARDIEARLIPRGYRGAWRQKRSKPDGLATFVKGAAQVTDEAVYFPDGSGHLALLSRLTVAGRTLLVANTHLKWHDPAIASESRWCVRQAEALAAELGSRGGDAIVCGDLNVTIGDATLERFFATGFRDIFAGAAEPHTCLSNGRTQKVDHILVRGALRGEPQTTPSAQGAPYLPSESEPSDHLPLVAEIVRPD